MRWAQLPDLYYAFDVGLWEIGRDTAAQPVETQIYITPRSMDHPTLAFAWEALAQREDRPITFDGRHLFPVTEPVATHPELYVVIAHEDFRSELLLPALLPNAEIVKELVDETGAVYARYYRRPPETTTARPPQQSLAVDFGDGISLVGYDVQPAALRPGEILYLQLHWSVNRQPAAEWTVFTHLLTADDADTPTLVAGKDGLPGAGSLPTTHWQPGMRILDEYQIALPADLVPGDYQLTTGLYQPTGERLPQNGEEVVLGTVTIE